MRRIQMAVPGLLLLTLAFMPITVSGETIAGTASINEGDFWHTEIPIIDTSEVRISITVTTGGPVDVFLVDEENFNLYVDREDFDFIEQGSRVNTSGADIIVTLEPATYFLVVDNSNRSGASPPEDEINDIATFSYNIDYPAIQDMILFFVVVITILALVVLFVFFIVRKLRQARQYRQPYPQPIPMIPQMVPCYNCRRQIPADSVVCPYCEIRQNRP